jgi:hypothetical protein
MSDDNDCQICFNGNANYVCGVFACSKQFHAKCLVNWQTQKETCPCCTNPMASIKIRCVSEVFDAIKTSNSRQISAAVNYWIDLDVLNLEHWHTIFRTLMDANISTDNLLCLAKNLKSKVMPSVLLTLLHHLLVTQRIDSVKWFINNSGAVGGLNVIMIEIAMSIRPEYLPIIAEHLERTDRNQKCWELAFKHAANHAELINTSRAMIDLDLVDLKRCGSDSMCRAANASNMELIALLIRHGISGSTNAESALRNAARRQDKSTCEVLIAAGADAKAAAKRLNADEKYRACCFLLELCGQL